MATNAEKYKPFDGYYDITKEREPNLVVVKAVTYLGSGQKQALDFGCGAGSETQFLSESGFTVTAIDGNVESGQYIGALPYQDKITFVHSAFEEFSFGSYDLIVASRSLPFVHKKHFDRVMTKIVASLKPGGILAANFYGPNDEWNKEGETMTFTPRDKIEEILSDTRILLLEEVEKDGSTANGKPKHIHLFEVIAQRPNNNPGDSENSSA